MHVVYRAPNGTLLLDPSPTQMAEILLATGPDYWLQGGDGEATLDVARKPGEPVASHSGLTTPDGFTLRATEAGQVARRRRRRSPWWQYWDWPSEGHNQFIGEERCYRPSGRFGFAETPVPHLDPRPGEHCVIQRLWPKGTASRTPRQEHREQLELSGSLASLKKECDKHQSLLIDAVRKPNRALTQVIVVPKWPRLVAIEGVRIATTSACWLAKFGSDFGLVVKKVDAVNQITLILGKCFITSGVKMDRFDQELCGILFLGR